MTVERSLLAPTTSGPIERALAWIEGALFGQIAVILCVLAVAFVGALMLTGRLPVRRGMMVVIGCFILLGAPIIAAGVLNAAG